MPKFDRDQPALSSRQARADAVWTMRETFLDGEVEELDAETPLVPEGLLDSAPGDNRARRCATGTRLLSRARKGRA